MDDKSLQNLSLTISEELRAAESGQSSSFAFIENPLPATTPALDATIQVLVIGGSICKKGVFKRVQGSYHLISSSQKAQPPFPSKDEFINFCLTEIDPTIPEIGINFAYPLSPSLREGRLDGKLISGMKENIFDGLTGEYIGETLERAIYEKNGKETKIAVANDTICLLLSGFSVAEYDRLTAGVIGTGINFAFFSTPENAINTEAANFNKFSPSEEAISIDSNSASQGSALFEKEIAGAYLYRHYNYYLAKHHLAFPPLSQTHELDILAQQHGEEGKIAGRILERSAKLSAALIAGVALFKKRDLTCVIEGSLFWKGYRYKEIVDETVSNILSGTSVTFVKIANSPLLGAAYLVG